MMVPFLMMITAIFITSLLFILAKILNSRNNMDREKASAFECGFDPKTNARIPFSLRFFMLAIIFIVFDIEIVLLVPTPLLTSMLNTTESMMVVYIFLFILMLGLFHEWKQGSLDWSS